MQRTAQQPHVRSKVARACQVTRSTALRCSGTAAWLCAVSHVVTAQQLLHGAQPVLPVGFAIDDEDLQGSAGGPGGQRRVSFVQLGVITAV